MEEYKPVLICLPKNMQEILDEINEDQVRDIVDDVYDMCGVQNMTAPSGLIFSMKAVYKTIAKGMRDHPYATLKHLEEMGYHD